MNEEPLVLDVNFMCPNCDSQEFVLLGQLGNQSWCRCRDCGADVNVTKYVCEDYE